MSREKATSAAEELPAYVGVGHRVKLGQPPATLKNEYTRVWLALETMWNIEQQGFEAVERLSQTLVLREDTRRRLRQEQKQVNESQLIAHVVWAQTLSDKNLGGRDRRSSKK